MARNIGSNKNFNQNEIQNAVIQNLATPPSTPNPGQVYFDTALTQYGVFNGTSWDYLTPQEVVVSAGPLSGAAPTGAKIGVDTASGMLYYVNAGNWTLLSTTDTHLGNNTLTLTGSGGMALNGNDLVFDGTVDTTISDSGAMTTGSANLTSDSNQIVLDSDGTNPLTLTSGTQTASNTITYPDETGTLATQSYVDTLVDGTLKTPEAYNPTTTSAFPTTYGGNAIEAGDSFRATAAGTMASGAVTVGPEDLIIALVDSATDSAADWQIAESNRNQATETVRGVMAIATSAEATTGTNDTDAMTPLKTQAALDARSFVQTGVAAGSGTPVNITHNLNTLSPHVTTWNEADNEEWELDVAIVNANTISIAKNGTAANFTVRVSY